MFHVVAAQHCLKIAGDELAAVVSLQQAWFLRLEDVRHGDRHGALLLVLRRHRTQTSGQQGLRHVWMSYIFCGDNSTGFLIIRNRVGWVGG